MLTLVAVVKEPPHPTAGLQTSRHVPPEIPVLGDLQAHPVHLWDACTGQLRCSYRAYDAVDEVTAATSLAFSLDGARLFGGFKNTIRAWDTSRPGRDYQEMVTFRKGSEGLPGTQFSSQLDD